MSRGARELADKIKAMCRPDDVTLDGEVTAVDESDYTCTVRLPSGLELENVHLKALKGSTKGFIVIPKVGSHVQIVNIGDPDYLVVAFEAVDKVIITAETVVEINGGGNAGLVIIGKLVERLNKTEQALADLIQKFNGHVHPGVSSGGGSTAPTTSLSTKTVTSTKQADIENTKVKH